MLKVEGLKKNYRIKSSKGFFHKENKLVEAVRGIDLEIKPGQIVGLLGVNGAGKTTTIKMLSTLLEPDGGKGSIDGMDLIKDARRIKPIVNMIAGGERMIYWRLTAKENLEYFGRLYNIPKPVLKERMEKLLDYVGLQEKADTPVEQYSKGMKQRLQIARGLINDPKYIFMDEPTLGLDAHIARELRAFTRKMAKEQQKGILLTSHYIHEIEELCDYVYIIDKGKKLMEGVPKEIASIVTQDSKKYMVRISSFPEKLKNELESFMHAIESVYKMEACDNSFDMEISSGQDIQSDLISLFSRHSRILSFSAQQPNLEDAIIKLSGVR